MERIGIAASKIAKGNLLLYNFFVIVLSFLFSLLIFILAGTSILIALVLIKVISLGYAPQNLGQEWTSVMLVCMISLTNIVSIFNLCAIMKNIKFSKSR